MDKETTIFHIFKRRKKGKEKDKLEDRKMKLLKQQDVDKRKMETYGRDFSHRQSRKAVYYLIKNICIKPNIIFKKL